MKSPSQFDGKPIGTPMDAKCAFHAGVTVGPDQIERMEAVRKLRNRAQKAARKAASKAIKAATPPDEREAYKRRRNRGLKMWQALDRGTPVVNVAHYFRLTTDEVLAEVKWYADHRNRHKARHRGGGQRKIPRGLPPREWKAKENA